MVLRRKQDGLLRAQDGFTIIELAIVCLIIGLLASIAIANYLKFADRAREALVKENMHVVHSGMEVYSVDHLGVYPTAAEQADLQNLMPNRQFPDNPYTNAPTPIVWDADPAAAGAVAIIFRPGGGYEIKGHSRTEVLDHSIVTGN